ncbi:MAG: hypothetical protein JXA94_00345 [Parachlamydiales bacterium]|nr:hypothetical protein [Parachlamydiales bacterium]
MSIEINIFPSKNRRSAHFESPINELAKAITNIVLLPIRLIASFFLLPLLLPLAIFHTVIAITINTFLFFTFATLSTLLTIASFQINPAMGLITLLLTIAIGFSKINEIQKDLEDNFHRLLEPFQIY